LKHPAVTIFIPTYNRAGLVPDAIRSALAQTYPNYSVVVSDNASTDGTAELVATFDDPRLRFVRRERHLELNEHYNVFMAEASSPYMFVLPDDDTMAPDALEVLMPVLEAHPAAGIAHGRARVVDGHGKLISADHDMTGLTETTVESGQDYIRQAFTASHRIHATATLYRTKAIQSVPLDPLDHPATEFGVWLRLALDWELAFVAATVATIRVHGGSYTAANARVTDGGYVQGVETIENLYQVKRRFLREHGNRLADPSGLARLARSARVSQLVNHAGHLTVPERRRRETARVLAAYARKDPRVAVNAAAWRLAVGSLLGPSLVGVIKRSRAGQSQLSAVSGR
jgi:glycosyltransferase involved in cell wall biosynthesis